ADHRPGGKTDRRLRRPGGRGRRRSGGGCRGGRRSAAGCGGGRRRGGRSGGGRWRGGRRRGGRRRFAARRRFRRLSGRRILVGGGIRGDRLRTRGARLVVGRPHGGRDRRRRRGGAGVVVHHLDHCPQQRGDQDRRQHTQTDQRERREVPRGRRRL